ncbi:hypothetical protein KGA66_04755 [Actinocrinis puniceicyclus]|uniref:3-hydroxyacyl-[acyl-carrier-protein] dehydratase n=1 Tax=Actinocrinis puniceicyclus TaxID=977794 RepID=A0A8J7WK50_9ACTN|nr:hypothetical protein [Actinocrinis puniceicyclus]MBS2962345.1 hypothetical protein [Actinocrinis puniceicyclus]
MIAPPFGPEQIKRLLPHRYPMLLVDRVTAAQPGVSLTAVKAVTVNEPCYRGLSQDADHDYPVSLLIESWCQAAGLLACLDRPNPDVLRGMVTLFGSITDLRLGRPARPGDLLEHRVRLVRAVTDAAVFEGESLLADGCEALSVASIVIALRPAESLRERTTEHAAR